VSNKPIIEKTVAESKKKSKRKYGRTPKPQEQVRSEHIGVYLTSAEIAELAALAGTHSPLQKRGGDTASRRKIAAYLRAAGLRKLPPIVPEISIEVWSKLSLAFEIMNQIAEKKNGGEDLDETDSLPIKTISDILTSLHPLVDCERQNITGG
jgi:hypothetical protein